MESITAVLLEYKRILAYAVAPTVAFITVGLLLPTDSAPPYVCPMVYLGLLTILSCFVFDSEGPDGFFVQPASSWEKGIRFFGVKVLELVGDKVAFSICGDGVTGRRAPFLDMNFGETVLYVTALTIMSVSFLRSVIFPLGVMTLVRTAGRWTSWAPFDR